MKGKHPQKNFGTVGTMSPTPLSLKTWGGVAYKDRARPPHPPCLQAFQSLLMQPSVLLRHQLLLCSVPLVHARRPNLDLA